MNWKNIRNFTMVLIVLLMSGMTPSLAAAATLVSMDDVTVDQGKNVTVSIMLTGITDYGTGTINVEYDPLVAKVTDVAGNAKSSIVASNADNSAGKVIISAWNIAGTSGDFAFADVTFKALGNNGSSTALTVKVDTLLDTSYAEISRNINSGSMTISGTQLPDFGISVSPGSATVIKGASTSASVTLTNIPGYDKNVTLSASGMPLNTTISFTPEKSKPNYSSTMLVKTDSSTPAGSYPITITGTGDDAKVHNTTFTLKVTTTTGGGAANASVSLGATIRPAIAIEVTPSAIDFGDLEPGGTSDGKNLTVRNKGGFGINVSAEVNDNAEDLFVNGMLLNDRSWSLYSSVIPKNGDDNAVAKLHVPENYAGAGMKEGRLMFWATKA
jgi:uncharacterized membrane protein